MFCQKCGKEMEDDTKFCPHCGEKTSQNESVQQTQTTIDPQYNVVKSGVGVLLAFFLGLIGLIIGVCIYPAGTLARQTFLKGFWITFGVIAGVALFAIFLVAASMPASYGGYYY